MSKRTHYILVVSVGIITSVSTLFFSPSCRKNTKCKATITVTSRSGASVSGLTVTIAPNQAAGNLSSSAPNMGSQQTQSGITDGSGSVSFSFTLPAILQASVSPCTGGCTALVELQEGQTVTQTITIN